jgi:hypothetical protein
MTQQLAISLLRQANSGDELLQVLDSLVSGADVNEAQDPTLEEIQF